MKFQFLLIQIVTALILNSFALAGYDASTFVNFRSYPLSASANLRGGYTFLLWGDSASDNPFYGYLRPNLTLATVGSYNSLTGQVDFFPVSFLGLKAGSEIERNDHELKGVDCTVISCVGSYSKTFWSGHLALGYANLFALLSYRQEFLFQDTNLQGFVDPSARLQTAGRTDRLSYSTLVAGYNQPDKVWSYFLIHSLAQMKNSRASSTIDTLNVQYVNLPLKLVFGAGQYESTLNKKGFTIISKLTWEFEPAIGIF